MTNKNLLILSIHLICRSSNQSVSYNQRNTSMEATIGLGVLCVIFIGFTVAWVAIHCSQMESYPINPITIVWFVAIPFVDCIGLIISRTLKGKSWASAGRDHIHHKLMQYFSPEGSLLIILLFSTILGFLGIILENNFKEYIS